MDITKASATIAEAKKAIKATMDATIEAGKKNTREFNGLKPLSGVDAALDNAQTKLEAAAKASEPRAKKERKSKKDKAAK